MISDANATLLARIGFAARGLVYMLVGWFAIDAGLRGGRAADNQGAIATLADEPFGHVLLAIVAAGLLGFALWRLTEGIANPERIGSDAKAGFKRAGQIVSGITHLVLAWTAARLAVGASSGRGMSPGDDSARDWTAWLLSQPLGQLLVGLVGLGLFAAAAQQGVRAWKGNFVDELRGSTPLPGYVCTVGRIGYAARALVFVIIGVFFIVAAWTARASEAGGMADALAALQNQPGGTWLLAATGLGLALFGIFSSVEARYRTIHVHIPG